MAKKYHFTHNNFEYVAIKVQYKPGEDGKGGLAGGLRTQAKTISNGRLQKGVDLISPLENGVKGTHYSREFLEKKKDQKTKFNAMKAEAKKEGRAAPTIPPGRDWHELKEWEKVEKRVVEPDVKRTMPDKKTFVEYNKEDEKWYTYSGGQRDVKTLADQKMIFVTMPGGSIRVGEPQGGENAHHALAGQSNFVRYAGEVLFSKGKLTKFNNWSGTYMPPRDLFKQSGFPPQNFEAYREDSTGMKRDNPEQGESSDNAQSKKVKLDGPSKEPTPESSSA